MSLAVIYTRATLGIHAPLVTVETHLLNGLPNFSIVGLPETVVKESKDRVRSAIINSHFDFPIRRIVVNLAPADLPKEGGRYDLPIALGILAASQQIPLASMARYEFAGELALSGALRSIQGTLPIALAAKGEGHSLILPQQNAYEAAYIDKISIYAANHLCEVVEHLKQRSLLTPLPQTEQEAHPIVQNEQQNLADIRGQAHAKRALEIAAAGGHNLLMVGPPGTGKTLLASALPGLLPPLSFEEALEVRALYSLSAQPAPSFFARLRPYRAPHHSISSAALVGGGPRPKPGEISLAHLGVLFLDELPEFDRKTLEVLREPLESGRILISRALQKVEFPANFQLISAMNPCPCGYLGDSTRPCRCTAEQLVRYRNRLSGPLLDRIDLHVEVPRIISSDFLQDTVPIENTQTVRARVLQAFAKQLARVKKQNAQLSISELEMHCALEPEAFGLVRQAMEKIGLSARSFHRILRVARTIADLAEEQQIATAHVKEALSYRQKSSPQTNGEFLY